MFTKTPNTILETGSSKIFSTIRKEMHSYGSTLIISAAGFQIFSKLPTFRPTSSPRPTMLASRPCCAAMLKWFRVCTLFRHGLSQRECVGESVTSSKIRRALWNRSEVYMHVGRVELCVCTQCVLSRLIVAACRSCQCLPQALFHLATE